MTNKLLKTLGALVLGAGLSFNSYGQDTLRNAEGYWIFNEKKQLISDVREKHGQKEVYEYDNNGKLKQLTTFSEGIKTQSYLYNEKGQLIEGILFDKDGKIKETINRKL